MEPELISKPTQVFMRHEGDLKRALTREQMRTINVLRGRSRNDSDTARDELCAKVTSVLMKGRKLQDIADNPIDASVIVNMIIDYIANTAPIVIHLTEQTLEILFNDTHYRSSFETGKTHGGSNVGSSNGTSYLKYALGGDKSTNSTRNYQSSREQWESECFLGLYNDLKSNFERPKYGALNFLNAPCGVRAARAYGQLYLQLQPHVRKRVTLSTGDTSSSRCLGVLDYCNHVLMHLSDQELIELIKIASGQIEYSLHTGNVYREIQIHGELDLSLDVASLHVPMHASESALKFSQQFGVPVVTFGNGEK